MSHFATKNMINYLIQEKSFALGYPIEASKMVQACDYFLTSCLGSTLKLIAIIDLDQHPAKRATFTQDEMNEFRKALSQFTYHAYGKRLCVSIEIWYIGKQASSLQNESDFHLTTATLCKFWVSAWTFDTTKNQVSYNNFSVRNWLRKRHLAKVFRERNFVHNELVVALT